MGLIASSVRMGRRRLLVVGAKVLCTFHQKMKGLVHLRSVGLQGMALLSPWTAPRWP